MSLELLTSYTWPTDSVPLASLSVRVDELATRLGLTVQAWQADGLGPARGFGVRLPSGRVILLEEFEIAIQYHGARGPVVQVDAAELAAVGSKKLVGEVVAGLGLSESDVVDVADETAQKRAAGLVVQVREAKIKRGSQGAGAEALGPGERV